jgi:hypothetical protein
MECKHCQNTFKSLTTLKQHQKTAKYCLIKQNNTSPPEFKCVFCDTCFTLKSSLNKHVKICKANCPAVKERESKLLHKLKSALLSLENSHGYFIEAPIKAKRNFQSEQLISPEYFLSFDNEFHNFILKYAIQIN